MDTYGSSHSLHSGRCDLSDFSTLANAQPEMFIALCRLCSLQEECYLHDMAFNVTMQPFRALVADMLNDRQKTRGYSVQTLLINIGAIAGSVLPFVLVNWFGMSNQSTPEARIPEAITWSYYIGAAVLISTVLITSFKTKEYPPAEFAKYNELDENNTEERPKFIELMRNTPKVMIQLAVVQFFSWASLFLLWTYSTPAVAENVWGVTDTTTAEYGSAGDWVGLLFGAYALFAALFAMVIPA